MYQFHEFSVIKIKSTMSTYNINKLLIYKPKKKLKFKLFTIYLKPNNQSIYRKLKLFVNKALKALFI